MFAQHRRADSVVLSDESTDGANAPWPFFRQRLRLPSGKYCRVCTTFD